MQFDTLDDLTKKLNFVQDNRCIFLVGAGRFGEIIGQYLDKTDIEWHGYVDKNSGLQEVLGKPVYSYAEASKRKDCIFIISSVAHKDELLQELYGVGVMEADIATIENREVVYEMMKSCVDYESYTNKLKAFHDKYDGKRCFVIGNGPSLLIDDLEKIKKEKSFAANAIYKLYPHCSWRPTFFCTYDLIFGNKYMATREDIEILTKDSEAAFTNMVLKAFTYRDEFPNLFFFKMLKEFHPDTTLPLFSEDCSKQIYTCATVSFVMLQLAIYMGFKEIYLLGMDCTYSSEKLRDGTIVKNNVKNHHELINEIDVQVEQQVIENCGAWASIDMMLDSFRSAKEYADSRGIKIYNATRGGNLEVFERVDFDKLF